MLAKYEDYRGVSVNSRQDSCIDYYIGYDQLGNVECLSRYKDWTDFLIHLKLSQRSHI